MYNRRIVARPTPEERRPSPTFARWLTEELRGEILRGDLPAGTRLRQAEIARRFGTSTTPVRESFAALQREGLLAHVDHGGVSVFKPTATDLRDNYEIRIVLEGLATEIAAPKLSDEALTELAALLAAMRETDFTEIERYHELNSRFHMRIYAEGGRPRLEKLIASFRQASGAYQRLFAVDQPGATETQEQHEEIFDACRRRDAVAAGDAVRRHLSRTHSILDAALRRHSGRGED